MHENEAAKLAEEFNIAKTILKTAFTFVLIFILIVILVFNVLALFFPGFVSDISKDLGMNGIAAEFSIGNYNKTKGQEDLALAVERCIIAKKHDKVVKYGKELIEFTDSDGKHIFQSLCEEKDKQLNQIYEENNWKLKSDYYLYIYGEYVYSLYKTGQKTAAYNIAKDKTDETNYKTNNMLTMFVNAYVEDKEKPDVEITKLLESLYDKLDTENAEQKLYAKNICLDLIIIYNNLNDNTNLEIWQKKFDTIK